MEAAEAWAAAGARYEHALALAEADDPQHLLTALELTQELGASPLTRFIRRHLRELGIVHVPRGPSQASRRNPAGLTARQFEVLGLVGEGLTNAEIALQLVVSVRTVETHVATAMDKLGVHTRREAAQLVARPHGTSWQPRQRRSP
jgi:DNA-binding NarL/FixJ family response regulator